MGTIEQQVETFLDNHQGWLTKAEAAAAKQDLLVLIERLRAAAVGGGTAYQHNMGEAADEIERLRTAVLTAYGNLWRVLTPGPAEIMARKALLAVMTPDEQRAAIAEHGQPLQGRISAL